MPSPRTSLAGTQSGPARERCADHQVGVVWIWCVEPGEADQRPDLAEPLHLDDVGEEAFQRRGHPLGGASQREVVRHVGCLLRGEDLPLRRTEVRVPLLFVRLAFPPCADPLDGRFDIVVVPLGEFTEGWDVLPSVGVHHLGEAGGLLPVLVDLVVELAHPGPGNGERAQGLREPLVGRADDQGLRRCLGRAPVGLERAEVRVTPPAQRQVHLAADAHGLAHVAGLAAAHALDANVGAEVAPEVEHLHPGVARIRAFGATVGEDRVREVVEVAPGAGEDEPGGDGQRWSSGSLLGTVGVEEPGVVRPLGPVVLEAEDLRVNRCELVARSAAQPCGER